MITVAELGIYWQWGGALLLLLLVSVLQFARRRPAGYPPGPRSLPIIGNLHQLGTHPFIKFMTMGKKYGDIFAVDFGSYPGIVLNEAKLIREALAMPEFCGRPKLRPFLERTGDGTFAGIVSNEGPAVVEQRRFVFRHLREFGMGKGSMESLIQEEIQELMVKLGEFALAGRPFQTKYIFNTATVNSLWWIVVGKRFAHDDPRLTEIVHKLTDGLMESPAAGAFFFFPWLTRIAPRLCGYEAFMTFQFEILALIRQQYKEQRASFESGRHRHFLDSFIQDMVDCKDPSSSFYGAEGEKNLIMSVADLFIAGIETTSTQMSWSILLLALHPEVQEKMHEEIIVVTGLSRAPVLDDLHKLPYTQAVIAEVLRFASIAPLAIFHATTQDVHFHGYKIPKDTLVMPNLYGVHHDPDAWSPDPDDFRPERFLTTGSDGSHVYVKPGEAFMPFSTGKRVCIGESMARNTLFIFLATLCQKYRVIPNPAKPKPKVDYTPTFVLQPKPYEYVLQIR